MKTSLLACLAATLLLPRDTIADSHKRQDHTVLRGSSQLLRSVSASDISCSSQGSYKTYKWGPSEISGYDNQVADIYLPSTPIDTPTPIVVLVHGGYWGDQYRRNTGLSSMVPLAEDLQMQGYVAVNLEYRRAANYPPGNPGGYTGTFNDLTDGVDALQWVESECGINAGTIDTSRIVIAGHSAGGHLALWRALQFGVSTSDRDATSGPAEYLHAPTLNPVAAIGLAAVSDFGDCATASCSSINSFMSYGTYGKTSTQVQDNLQVWSPRQMLPNANAAASAPIRVKLVHCSGDTTVDPPQSSTFFATSAQYSNIDTTYDSCSGSHFNVVDPDDASWTSSVIPFLDELFCSTDTDCNDGLFCNGVETCTGGICVSGTNPCPLDQTCKEDTDECSTCTEEDFEAGSSGWIFDDPASSCSTGSFVVGTPNQIVTSGVTTQVGGDHTTGSGNAFYTQPNGSAGNQDVDGGECVGLSRIYQVSQESTLSIWYFHGQRDAGDDAAGDYNGDYFALEMSTDGGSTWGTTLASHGDLRLSAVWTEATASVPAGSNIRIRVRVSDGAGSTDLIEAGVDDLSICAV